MAGVSESMFDPGFERRNSVAVPRPQSEKPDRGWLEAVPCSEIVEESISWVWRGYIPRSALTLLEGPPKAGKSTVLADIIARVTSGAAMPDGQPCERPGAVLMLSDEDHAAAVIVPRLRIAGAQLDRVRIVKAHDAEGRPRKLVIGTEDTALLENEIEGASAVLVVVDPLSIYMGAVDSHRELEVRQVLWFLSELAERTGVSVLGVRHWNKVRTGDALAQGGGSVGFSAAARALLSVARDPDNKASRVLAAAHSNYATDYPSLAFHLESAEGVDVARVAWDGISRHDADSLAAIQTTPGERTKLQKAVDFLNERIGTGRAPVPELKKAADAYGIAWRTVLRAKDGRYSSEKAETGAFWEWVWMPEGDQACTNGRLPIGDRDSDGLLREDGRLPGLGDAAEPERGPP
jgi:hypothetical protein